MRKWMLTTREIEACGPISSETYPPDTPVVLVFDFSTGSCDVEFPGGRVVRIGSSDVSEWEPRGWFFDAFAKATKTED